MRVAFLISVLLVAVMGRAEESPSNWDRYKERVRQEYLAQIDQNVAEAKAKLEKAKKGVIDRRAAYDFEPFDGGAKVKFKTALSKKKFIESLQATIDGADERKAKVPARNLQLPLMTPMVGDIGTIPGGDPWVQSVVDEKTVVVKVNYVYGPEVRARGRDVPFVYSNLGAGEIFLVVSGVSTEAAVDDKPIRLTGMFEIVGTRKATGRTMYELRPFVPPKE